MVDMLLVFRGKSGQGFLDIPLVGQTGGHEFIKSGF
jgi:hypothetical protein